MSAMFKQFECMKCGKRFEGILDVCGSCGSRAKIVSGIRACLDSGRPPGYAGGSNKPYSARSYDRCLENNFKQMGITNCQHKDGVPVCTFANKVDQVRQSYPSWAGQQQPIKAYGSMESMKRDGINMPSMMIEGKPFAPPQVHPEIAPGAIVGRFPSALRDRTLITGRSNG